MGDFSIGMVVVSPPLGVIFLEATPSGHGWCCTHNNKRTQVMKTLKLSVILALVSAVFGATALSAAHSPRGASNESSKSAKGHCDSKGGACCKKDCKK